MADLAYDHTELTNPRLKLHFILGLKIQPAFTVAIVQEQGGMDFKAEIGVITHLEHGLTELNDLGGTPVLWAVIVFDFLIGQNAPSALKTIGFTTFPEPP